MVRKRCRASADHAAQQQQQQTATKEAAAHVAHNGLKNVLEAAHKFQETASNWGSLEFAPSRSGSPESIGG
ncbi:hypothetical protein FGB62_337g04 [Gracilaria domingensis]|nr:hypothetical protein FGB62_337g04 [Gracilaria domingensis]